MKPEHKYISGIGAVLLMSLAVFPAGAQQDVDYLSFANGALPVSFGGDSESLKTGFEQALSSIDENEAQFVMPPKWGAPQTAIELTYELPALTTFESFAVPGVFETPSPYQTFFRQVFVLGSVQGPAGPFEILGSTVLEPHSGKGQLSRFTAETSLAVRWVKLKLEGGIDIHGDKTFFEFSEIIGYGHQEPVPMSDAFTGKWKGRGVLMELRQESRRGRPGVKSPG